MVSILDYFRPKSKMFHKVTRTWNPITGCLHYCVYCWARRLAEGRLKNTKKYSEGFKPRFHPEELRKKFKPGEFVFVADMGDMFGKWVPKEWILKVLEVVKRYPGTTFLLLTKNPKRYLDFYRVLEGLDNVVLGATIETDDDVLYFKHRISRAPMPCNRFQYMELAPTIGRTMLSIEPILDFDLNIFLDKILKVEPEFVYVGYDNYNNKLHEPPLHKTMELIDQLKEHGITVYTKTLRKAWYEVQGP